MPAVCSAHKDNLRRQVQEQAEDILVPALLQNCLILNDISLSYSLSPLQNSGPCNSFYCLGHFKNVYDDNDGVGSHKVTCIKCQKSFYDLVHGLSL